MLLGNLHGSIPEFANMARTPWTQSLVDDRWRQVGASPPAPIVPASMVGWYMFVSRGPRMLTQSPGGKKARPVTREENDFLNYFGQIAIDPYRKQKTLSKIAEGVLTVVSVAVPAAGAISAVKEVGNAGIAYSKQGSQMRLAERVLTPAIEAQVAKDTAASIKTDPQLQKLTNLMTPSVSSAPKTSPVTNARLPRVYLLAIPLTALALGLLLSRKTS